MKNFTAAIQYKEGRELLFDSSMRAIPFNVIMASLLGIYLCYHNVPKSYVFSWLALMVVVSTIRMIQCKIVIKNQLYADYNKLQLRLFLLFTFLTGIIWSSIYFLALLSTTKEDLYIILFFGGMSAGATTSLAVYIPAFFLYISSIFLPIIIYNYSFAEFNHSILGTMILLFLLAISIIAKSYQRVLQKIFYLTEENKLLLEKFEILSVTDALTGLFNRRHFTKSIQEEYNRAKRNQQSLALVSIDLDNFKLLNDNFGHTFGDNFLKYTAEYLKHYLRRANDIIFRLGGDEFSALLINTSEESVKSVCEQLKSQFKINPAFDCQTKDENYSKILDQISLSIGVVYVSHDSNVDVDNIIEKVDQLLYQAKNQGKNEIEYSNIV